MQIQDLLVIHAPGTGAMPGALAAQEIFTFVTCQRRVWIGQSSALNLAPGGTGAALAAAITSEPQAFEVHQGVAAYRFLLQLGTGLLSALAGETEILGQLKQAWRDFERSPGKLASALAPWMQRLFEDIKEVRHHCLRNHGGGNYGSALRKLLPAAEGKLSLLIGAGALADAVLPYLPGKEILLANRCLARAQELATRHAGRGVNVRVVADAAMLEQAWREADLIVLCVPPDAEQDVLRINAWRDRHEDPVQVVHLGLSRAAGSPWSEIPGLLTLESLFALSQTQSVRRAEHLARAEQWCATRAQLRALGRSITLAHGWEDLAAFTSSTAVLNAQVSYQ